MSGNSLPWLDGPLVGPEPIYTPGILSGASFLYFDKPIWVTLVPTVSLYMADVQGFLDVVEQNNPTWAPDFRNLMRTCSYVWNLHQSTLDMLEPLRAAGALKIMWLIYERNAVALTLAKDLIAAAGMSPVEVAQHIDPFAASAELVSHVLCSMYFELGGQPSLEPGGRGAEFARPDRSAVLEVADYCDGLFRENSFRELLTYAYVFRVPGMARMCDNGVQLLVTNPWLLTLLKRLPVAKPNVTSNRAGVLHVAGWEVCRQLLSGWLDPLDPMKVDLITGILEHKRQEVASLRARCLEAAETIGDVDSVDALTSVVRDCVIPRLAPEVAEVLSLNREARYRFLEDTLSDAKVFGALATGVYSLVTGVPWLSAAAALGVIATVSGSAIRTAAWKRQKLAANRLALLYSLERTGTATPDVSTFRTRG